METNNVVTKVREDGTKRVQIFFDKVDPETGEMLSPSMTKQSFRKETDINAIMAKYEKTGVIEHVSRYQGQYGDFTEVVDYQTALNTVIAADEMFMSLPANVRKEFENDPSKFLTFVDDPKNIDKMVELGLVPADKIPPKQEDVGGVTKDTEVSDKGAV